MRVKVAAALLAAAVAVGTVGADPGVGATDQPVTRHRDGSPRVAVVGDSLTVGMADDLAPQLPTWGIDLDAQVGRSTSGAFDAVAGTHASTADVVVLALGTNDGGGATEEMTRRLLVAVGRRPRKVVWVLPARTSPAMDVVRAAVRRGLAGDRRVVVVDWQTDVEGRPAYVGPDGVHLSRDGYLRRARVVALAVRGDRALAARVPG